jgi:protein involved in polysaccharide export with SLBB domain
MKKLAYTAIVLALFAFTADNGFGQQQPKPNMSLAKGYQIGPGDEITVKVLGEPQFDFVATVDENGALEVPFFEQPIIAKCKTERELRADVATVLGRYLRNPQMSLRISDSKSRPPVTIYGEVKAPQQVVLMRRATLVELLAFSGGVTEDAGGVVQVFRTQPPICAEQNPESNWVASSSDPLDVPSRVFSLSNIQQGQDDAAVEIVPGDVIIVHKASPVYITGEVAQPQGIYLKERGLTLTEAIAKVGGVRRESRTKEIKIYRQKPNSKDRDIIVANYELIKRGEQVDPVLEPYDIVEVDKAKDTVAQTLVKVFLGAGRTVVSSVSSGVGYRILY